MDTFAALALATDPATRTSLDRKPDRKDAPLISVDMWKMIVTQALYQIVVCLVLHFAGLAILRETGPGESARRVTNNADLGCVISANAEDGLELIAAVRWCSILLSSARSVSCHIRLHE